MFSQTHIQINDKFILEGVIKVYWGLRNPVTLADSEVSHYWKHFQPDDGTKRMDNTENVPPIVSIHLFSFYSDIIFLNLIIVLIGP